MTPMLRPVVGALSFALAIAVPVTAQSRGLLERYAEASAAGDAAETARIARRILRAQGDELGLTASERQALTAELVRALLAADQADRAADAIDDLIAEIEADEGEGSYQLVAPLELRADIQEQRGDALGAAESLDRAIAISAAVLGDQHPRLLPLLERRSAIADVAVNACEGAQIAGFTAASPRVTNDAGEEVDVDPSALGDEAIDVLGCNEQGVFFDFSGLRVWVPRVDVELVGLPAERPACVRGDASGACIGRDAWFALDRGAGDLRRRAATLRESVEARREPLETLGQSRTIGGFEQGGDEEAFDLADEPPFEVVRVFYGTSRARSGRTDPTKFYTDGRAVERGLETGIVSVSVPTQRELGAVPKPNIWLGQFRPDPAKHVIVEDVVPFPGIDAFVEELREVIDNSEKREAFIYIHGFNNDFGSAAERTAQLAADLELDGAPLLYSWPSRGDFISYFADAAQLIAPAVRDLEQFLDIVARRSGADRLHLVAHSMGNRYLIEALERIDSNRSGSRRMFDEVVFAAPDVDADDFATRIPELQHLASRMTLYASEDDRALQLSRFVNGGYRRAGDASNPLVLADLETIDTSPAPTPRFELGHQDVFEFALDDFRAVVWFSLDPAGRCVLEDRTLAAGVVWAYSLPRPEVCDADTFNAAIVFMRRLGRTQALQLLRNQVELTETAGDRESADRWRAVLEIVEAIGGR